MGDVIGINSLPNELLGDIFLHYQRALEGGNEIDYRPRLRSLFLWKHIMLVCRHWREVALNIAALSGWVIIDIASVHRIKPVNYIEDPDENLVERTERAQGRLSVVFKPRTTNAPLEMYLALPSLAIAILPGHILATQAHRLHHLTIPTQASLGSSTSFTSLLEIGEANKSITF